MTETPMCCSPACTTEATFALRVLPRRTAEPLCRCVANALAWPGAVEPTTLYACTAVDHRQAIREAAQVVLSARTLGEETVSREVTPVTDERSANACQTTSAARRTLRWPSTLQVASRGRVEGVLAFELREMPRGIGDRCVVVRAVTPAFSYWPPTAVNAGEGMGSGRRLARLRAAPAMCPRPERLNVRLPEDVAVPDFLGRQWVVVQGDVPPHRGPINLEQRCRIGHRNLHVVFLPLHDAYDSNFVPSVSRIRRCKTNLNAVE